MDAQQTLLNSFGLEAYTSSVCKPGDKFGRLTVLVTGRVPGTYRYRAVCQCDCGSPIKDTMISSLRNGQSQGCGCVQKDITKRHGLYKHPLYVVWSRMIARCTKPSERSFVHYGGRGISVCERWQKVEAFIEDMWPTYKPGLSIERRDVNGNYEPSNCEWASDHAQRRNRRNNIFVTINGETKVLGDWCADYGIRYQVAWERIKKMGWDPVEAITTPLLGNQGRRAAPITH